MMRLLSVSLSFALILPIAYGCVEDLNACGGEFCDVSANLVRCNSLGDTATIEDQVEHCSKVEEILTCIEPYGACQDQTTMRENLMQSSQDCKQKVCDYTQGACLTQYSGGKDEQCFNLAKIKTCETGLANKFSNICDKPLPSDATKQAEIEDLEDCEIVKRDCYQCSYMPGNMAAVQEGNYLCSNVRDNPNTFVESCGNGRSACYEAEAESEGKKTIERGCISSSDNMCKTGEKELPTANGNRKGKVTCCQNDKCNDVESASVANLAGWKLLFFTMLLTVLSI